MLGSLPVHTEDLDGVLHLVLGSELVDGCPLFILSPHFLCFPTKINKFLKDNNQKKFYSEDSVCVCVNTSTITIKIIGMPSHGEYSYSANQSESKSPSETVEMLGSSLLFAMKHEQDVAPRSKSVLFNFWVRG